MWRCLFALAMTIGLALPQPSVAKVDCNAETSALKSLANGVKVNVAAPAVTKVGETVEASWSVAKSFPSKIPVYVVLSIPGEARFELKIAAEGEQSPESEPADADRVLPGFLALTPETRGPYGIKTGLGNTRVLIPLHSSTVPLSGSFSIRMFTAGDLALTSTVVAATRCGEQKLAEQWRQKISIAAAAAEVVVQNPYDIEVPVSAVASNNGRYMLQVFKGHYRVFETATGAKLLDRAGHDPNFSPTSRFIVADIGDADGRDFEVVDLVSRTVVARPLGPFIGWLYGDSVLLDGAHQYGLGFHQALVGRSGVGQLWNRFVLDHTEMDLIDSHDDHLWSYHGSECHGCVSWSSRVTIDLEGRCGVALAAGPGPGSCPVPGTGPVWQATETLAFTHVLKPKPEDLNPTDEETKREIESWRPLLSGLIHHRQIPAKSVPQQIAMVLDGVKVRGDWIGVTPRTPLSDPKGLTKSLITELEGFGVKLAPVNAREGVPFAPPMSDGEDLGVTGQSGTTPEDAERLTNRLVSAVPALKQELAKDKEANSYSTETLNIERSIMGVWGWVANGRPLFLLQTFQIEGSGAFGGGYIYLLDGRQGASSVTTIAAEGFWDGNYGSTAEQTRIRVQLISDRYLVMASAVDKTLAVYDVTTRTVVAVLKDVPQADLIADLAMSSDGRLIIQINSDGQFFIHDVASRGLIVLGRYLDGETILYTTEGYYWSSYEGAHFLNLRFPGVAGQFPFHQFAAVLNRKDIVEARLRDAGHSQPAPTLVPPPTADMEFATSTSQNSTGKLLVRVRSASPSGVAHLRFYQDGQLIRQVEATGKDIQGAVALDTAPHARWLTMLAVDTNGLVSAPQALHLRARTTGTNRLHAILVGVDTYSDPRNNLTYAKSDAKRLSDALAASQGRYYATEDVKLLLDQNATPSSIASALEEAVNSAQPQDTILFSFAGHGVQGADGHYYLAPSGFKIEDPIATGLSWSKLAQILGRSKARIILVLDACHSGLSGSEGLASNDQAAAALLSGTRAPMLVLAASKGREKSYEGKRWGGGAFTYALSQVLKNDSSTYDQDKDGTIGVSELYRGLREIVTRETGGRQTPWLARQDLIGDFALF